MSLARKEELAATRSLRRSRPREVSLSSTANWAKSAAVTFVRRIHVADGNDILNITTRYHRVVVGSARVVNRAMHVAAAWRALAIARCDVSKTKLNSSTSGTQPYG